MAEGNPRERSKPDTEPEIGAAELLFRDDPAAASPRPTPSSSSGPSSAPNDVFELVEQPESPNPTPTGAAPPIPAASRKGAARAARQPGSDRAEDPSQPDPAELVEEVWSRMGEWGQTLIVLGGWL